LRDQETGAPLRDQETAEKPATGLYIVGTPIGNLEDITHRALRILARCTWVAAEDTRETRKLLEHYGIQVSGRLHSLHEHSTRSRIEELVGSLEKGESGAYVSDAGTPGLCDPGSDLVVACAERGIPVYAVPGASAVLALLSVSGFKESSFLFHGFFPREKKERDDWAKGVKLAGGQHFFFESPHRIVSALEHLAATFPDGKLVVGRELTKKFETLTRGSCAEVSALLGKEEPRGEYVLGLSLPAGSGAGPGLGLAGIGELVKELAQLGATQKVLVRAAMSHGLRKNEAYKLALEMLEK
jgi:16S rRNA (cytidine1402-2'-O)-methyltransferase